MDARTNFGIGTVLTAPSPAASGTTLTLSSGAGALMPAVPFNATIWPPSVDSLPTNAEIVRVTAMTGDAVTAMTRHAETWSGSAARSILAGWNFRHTITKKFADDIESELALKGTVSSVGLTLPGILTVIGSPVTGSGTLAVSLATQNANLVFAGPATGGAAAPTFRSLVAADITGLAGAGGSLTQIQFHDTGGVLGGFGSWDGTTLSVFGAGVANKVTLTGAATGEPVLISAAGSDADIAVKIRGKGPQGFVQLGQDTHGPAYFSGASLSTELYQAAGIEETQYGHVIEMNSGDVAGAFVSAIESQVNIGSIDSTQNQYQGEGFSLTVISYLPTGLTLDLGHGGNLSFSNYGDGHVVEGSALILQTDVDNSFFGGGGSGTVDAMYGVQLYIYQNTGVITDQYGYYVSNQHFGGTTTNLYLFYASDFAGAATNPYYMFLASRGVLRIREDNVADGSGNPQAIIAGYNPRFTQYVAAAPDYERWVAQFVGNVFQIGTEVGNGSGGGVLRGVQIIGASLTVPGGTLLATSSALTNGAAASLGTITNAPAAGNPTKWIPINDNGTTRYIPAW